MDDLAYRCYLNIKLISTSNGALALTPTGEVYTFNLQSKEWVDLKIQGIHAAFWFNRSVLLLQGTQPVAVPVETTSQSHEKASYRTCFNTVSICSMSLTAPTAHA